MKILHLSKMDAGGGAADGFVRVHRALLAEGHHSVAYVIKQKRQDVPAMIDARRLLGPLEKLAWGLGRVWAKLRRLHLKPVGVYDFDAEANYPAEPIIRHARTQAEKWDLVLVHWSGAFVRPETIREIGEALGARVALWQVDMAHATGGCHSNLGCLKYQSGCGACPLLGSTDPKDVSAVQAERRTRIWKELGVFVLAPSGWSARQAKESFTLGGLDLRTFPIPLDLAMLKPTVDQLSVRRELGLPAEGRIVLVRALDPAITYKGFGLFLQALRRLDDQGVTLHVAVIGDRGFIPAGFRHITFTELGPQRGDAALARAYQAADFFVSPSTNETGPMMAGEAMACGRPLIAYPIGIAPDLVEQGRNGTLVEPVGDVAALATAIRTYAEMPAGELAARQQAAADSAGRILSAGYFAEQVQAALCR
ncbi:MAG: glycosyltransferase [Opitutales bacterium]|nr:glycosyltransferase [Opitutales bacterium]